MRVAKRRLGAFLLLAAMGSLTAACAGIFGFERLSEGSADGGNDGATVDGGVDAPISPEASAECRDIGIPPKPTVGPGDGAASVTVLAALDVIDFGIDAKTPAFGLNLDRTCSPTPDTSSCRTNVDALTFDNYIADKGPAGVDNAGFNLLQYLGGRGDAFKPEFVNERLQAGEFGVVMRVTDWNGTPEDDNVFVELFPAIGVWERTDSGELVVPPPGTAPTRTRTDLWRRDRRFQNVVDASRIKSATAWVTGGKLVAAFPYVTLPISVPDDPNPLDITVDEGYMVGQLVADGSSYRIADGVIGGRWSTAELLDKVRTIYVKDSAGVVDGVLCEPGLPAAVYEGVKREVCGARDIRSKSLDDNTGKGCNGISVGVRIQSYGLDRIGDFDDRVIEPRCENVGDGGVPKGDDCAPIDP